MESTTTSRTEARQQAKKAQRRFETVRRAEAGYVRQLRAVARHIDNFIRGFVPRGAEEVTADVAARIEEFLRQYAMLLRPWAERVAQRMLVEVSTRDMRVWSQLGNEMGIALRREIETAPTGDVMRQALADQVHLITSLPRDAADRVHHLTNEGIIHGRRAKEIADEIMKTGEVTRSRAELIARTESSRTSAELTKARAQHIGATHFQWITAGDRNVRPRHRKLNGKVFAFDDPPVIGEKGERGLPGTIYNCRCVMLPVIPEQFFLPRRAEAA